MLEDRDRAPVNQAADAAHSPTQPANCPSPQIPSQTVTTDHTFQSARRKHLPRPLTQTQLNAIDLILQGRSDGDVAAALSVDRCTVNRWRNQHLRFRQSLARRRALVQDQAADRFRALLSQALKEFAHDLNSTDDRARFRAAASLLAEAGKNRFAPPDSTPLEDELLRQLLHAPPIANQNSKIENQTPGTRPGID